MECRTFHKISKDKNNPRQFILIVLGYIPYHRSNVHKINKINVIYVVNSLRLTTYISLNYNCD